MRKWIIAATVALSACAGTPFKWDDARKIQAGMTTQQVTEIMGTPTAVRAQNDVVRYVWVEVNGFTASSKTLSIDFKDGKAIKAPPIPEEFK